MWLSQKGTWKCGKYLFEMYSLFRVSQIITLCYLKDNQIFD